MQVTESEAFDPMTPSNLQEPFGFFAKLRKGEAGLLERAIFILDADAVSGCEGRVTGAAPILVCDWD